MVSKRKGYKGTRQGREERKLQPRNQRERLQKLQIQKRDEKRRPRDGEG